MKQIIILLIAASFFLSACTGNEKSAEKNAAEAVQPGAQFPAGAKIDLDIAGFEFAKIISPDLFLYTRNGPPDLRAAVEASGMELGVMDTKEIFNNDPFENRRGYLFFKQSQMKEEQGAGAFVIDEIKKDTVVNGHKAAIYSYSISGNARGAKVFSALADNGSKTILFYCIDYDNGRYMDEFQKTFYTLSFK